jgi:hypothetical protein
MRDRDAGVFGGAAAFVVKRGEYLPHLLVRPVLIGEKKQRTFATAAPKKPQKTLAQFAALTKLLVAATEE